MPFGAIPGVGRPRGFVRSGALVVRIGGARVAVVGSGAVGGRGGRRPDGVDTRRRRNRRSGVVGFAVTLWVGIVIRAVALEIRAAAPDGAAIGVGRGGGASRRRQ